MSDTQERPLAVPDTSSSTFQAPTGGFVLEADVPMPAQSGTTSARLYPWHDMQVGQSFFVGYRMKNPRAAIVGAMDSTKFKLEYRRTSENDVDGVRFWRTA